MRKHEVPLCCVWIDRLQGMGIEAIFYYDISNGKYRFKESFTSIESVKKVEFGKTFENNGRFYIFDHSLEALLGEVHGRLIRSVDTLRGDWGRLLSLAGKPQTEAPSFNPTPLPEPGVSSQEDVPAEEQPAVKAQEQTPQVDSQPQPEARENRVYDVYIGSARPTDAPETCQTAAYHMIVRDTSSGKVKQCVKAMGVKSFNRVDILALKFVLEHPIITDAKTESEVTLNIHSSNKLFIGVLNSGQLDSIAERGWKTISGKDVSNSDLWKSVYPHFSEITVNGVVLNSDDAAIALCLKKARAAADSELKLKTSR